MTNNEFTDSIKQKELLDYIKRQIQNGESVEEVKNVLLKAGWQTTDVSRAFELLNNKNKQNEEDNKILGKNEIEEVKVFSNTEISRQDKTRQDKKNSRFSKKTLLIFTVILLIFGIGAFASDYFYFRSPERILKKMFLNSVKIKSAEFNGKIKLKIKGGVSSIYLPMFNLGDKENFFSVNFDGASDNYEKDNPKGYFYFDIESDLFQKNPLFSIETRILKDNAYFKLSDLNLSNLDLAFFGLSGFSGEWININLKNLEKQYGLKQKNYQRKTLTEEDVKKLDKLTKEHRIFKEIKKLPNERINGKDVYHLNFKIDKEAVKIYILEVVAISFKYFTEEEIQGIQEMQKTFDDIFKMFDFGEIEVWIGKKDFLPYKFSAAVVFSENSGVDEASGKMSISMSFKNYNKPVGTEIPENAKPFEEIFKNFLETSNFNPLCDRNQDKNRCLESSESDLDSEIEKAEKIEKDATRVSDVKHLQLAVEMYFDDNKSYPSSLNKLTPKYITEIPVDPLDKKSYFYTIHISDGILSNTDKGKFDGYHIGADFEIKDNIALRQDKDCNSIIGTNCNFEAGYKKTNAFNGNDLQGCDNQINRYCYDVENLIFNF